MFPVTAVDLSSSAIRAVYTVCRCLLIETSQINRLQVSFNRDLTN